MSILNEGQTTILFHGTSSAFLPQIMKHGLQPNVEHRSWVTGSSGGESYGGVYLTADIYTAKNAAYAASKKHGGQPVVLKVQYHAGSGSLDEDEIVDTIIGNAKYAVIHNDYSTLMKDILSSISGKPTRITGTYISNLLSFLFGVFKKTKNLRDDWLIDDKLKSNPTVREMIQKIMESVRVVDMNTSTNVRITRPITFKGKTRILGVYNDDQLDEAISLAKYAPKLKKIIQTLLKEHIGFLVEHTNTTKFGMVSSFQHGISTALQKFMGEISGADIVVEFNATLKNNGEAENTKIRIATKFVDAIATGIDRYGGINRSMTVHDIDEMVESISYSGGPVDRLVALMIHEWVHIEQHVRQAHRGGAIAMNSMFSDPKKKSEYGDEYLGLAIKQNKTAEEQKRYLALWKGSKQEIQAYSHEIAIDVLDYLRECHADISTMSTTSRNEMLEMIVDQAKGQLGDITKDKIPVFKLIVKTAYKEVMNGIEHINQEI